MHPKLFIASLVLLIASTCHVTAASTKKVPQTQYYAITGTHTGVNSQTGARPARRNIDDLQKDTPSWCLYIQALQAMQKANELTDQTSFFQIAGIHGRPFISWNNVPQTPGAGVYWPGYCTHDSVLFPTWHRPYLAFFEQTLCQHAQAIAQQYGGGYKSIYQAAANNLRIPYWDWASDSSIPNIVNEPTVQINTPSGVQTVSNPLYQYKFQNFPLNPTWFPPNQDGDLNEYSETVRCPDTTLGPSDFGAANYYLSNDNLKSRTYMSLAKSTSFDMFATTATSGPAIEAVHNSVHEDVGGNGHMADLSYSAFDPIFWLHHCNVDRLIALFQASHPNLHITPLEDPISTWTIVPGSTDTTQTPLKPFTSNTGGTFWTSDSAWSLSPFGYSYPEIQDWDQSTGALQSNVTSQINQLYGPTPATNSTVPSARRSNIKIARSLLLTRSEVREWSVAISVSKFDLQGKRFTIRIFVGDVPTNPAEWSTSPSCVGSFPIMPPSHGGQGPLPAVTVYDEVSLMNGLQGAGYDGQDVDRTVGYLKGALQWGVQLSDGTVIPNEQVQSLKVECQDEIVTYDGDISHLPTYGQKTMHPEVTQGKAGGYPDRA